jgi:prevent-host-death family protein
MQSISMVEFRHHAQDVVERVRRGQRLMLTYRGKDIARIEPVEPKTAAGDPFYGLAGLADAEGGSLSNREMDEAVYGL